MRASEVEAVITFAEGLAIIRRKGKPDVRAKVLGEVITDDQRRIYLDRLVHEPCVDKLGDYQVSGCISSILTAPAA